MSSIAEQLTERRAGLIKKAQDLAQQGVSENRDLTVEEQAAFDGMIAEAEQLFSRAKAIAEGEERARDLENSFRNVTGRELQNRDSNQGGESGLAKWAREARIGDGFDIAPVQGAEARAYARVVKGEQRAMSASGGVAQDGVYGQLWEYAVAASHILQAGVQIINTADGNTLPFPVATVHATTSDTPTAANASLNSSDATITTVNNTVSKYTYLTMVPSELVQDTTFDLEGYLARAGGRELGRRVGKVASTAAVAGFTTVGVTGPVGTTTTLGAQQTAGQGTDLLVNLFHSVLPEYRTNSAWLMADPTVAIIRNLKSGTTGDSAWIDLLTEGDPMRLLGKGVYIDPNLPSPAANAKTIYYGDWAALIVRIAGGLRFERSNEYGFGNDQIAYRAIVRAGSVALDANAVKFFAHSAT